MTNYCEYKVIVKGKKNSCYAFFGSMSYMDEKWIEWEKGEDDSFEMKFKGNCKWSVDSYCNNNYAGEIPAFIPDDFEEARNYAEEHYWYNTVQRRSEMFQVEVKCNSADVEYDPEHIEDNAIYEHYKDGKTMRGKCPKELIIHNVVFEYD